MEELNDWYKDHKIYKYKRTPRTKEFIENHRPWYEYFIHLLKK